ncbi:hypothetical protein E2C01_065309 [Portunus trituberculatus]|uniref:Uncharacterized protein n=1 Tax=Portunus trituberculatus TaxID=210409 RepID=A0A5B7HIH9_PORTR|nr:hypothetical protein [Portunus trituberculatus]
MVYRSHHSRDRTVEVSVSAWRPRGHYNVLVSIGMGRSECVSGEQLLRLSGAQTRGLCRRSVYESGENKGQLVVHRDTKNLGRPYHVESMRAHRELSGRHCSVCTVM